MIPSLQESFLYIVAGCIIQVVGRMLSHFHRKIGIVLEIIIALVTVGVVFYLHSFVDGFIYLALLSTSYFAFQMLTIEQKKYKEVKEKLLTISTEKIILTRHSKRIVADVGISLFILSAGLIFLHVGPNESPLKYLIIISLVSAGSEIYKRIYTFYDLHVYIDREHDRLYFLSRYQTREVDLHDCEFSQIESSADLLKLHPYLTLFTTNTDFTTSFTSTLRLSLPGETIYFTVENIQKWSVFFKQYNPANRKETIEVLPFYHVKNIKRLLSKLYFAATIKGVSAYSGVILLLYFLHAPPWVYILCVGGYWGINLWISDKVLKVAMDAKEVEDQELQILASTIFKKAKIKNVKLYETESAQYNGLATGMNIGRAMITLTSSTLTLPKQAIEGILAHEAIHVQKRDVLWMQIWKSIYVGFVILMVLLIQNYVDDIDTVKVQVFIGIWLMMILFPLSQSFVSQWMEVRADHKASELLPKKQEQMAESLILLAEKHDYAMNKATSYSMVESEKTKQISSLERDSWIWRFIEFQFMAHPPMYWRIRTLKEIQDGWGRRIWMKWLKDRIKESFGR
ncbi:M56 family metallopeptidase [Bacillus weihaiensis]|uniref:M56 family metallopeptidase n=1 Tax=Bacillus weihaiensis TaxID=1547283 RepID=UPI002355A2CB|nr:M56 family metallopeptidase [Bacillus weihaiensis]